MLTTHKSHLISALGGALTLLTASIVTTAQSPHDTKAHRHPEAMSLQNPVTDSAREAGRRTYTRRCAECHGDEGKGDGMMGEDLMPSPADLTDSEWFHGNSDGEIFSVIANGTDQGMKPFKDRLSETQIWEVVVFIRSLGGSNK